MVIRPVLCFVGVYGYTPWVMSFDIFCDEMKKIAFIVPYPKGEAPSQRFRFEQYLELLEGEGYVIDFHPFIDQKTWETLYAPGNYLKKVGGMLRSFLRRWCLLPKLRKSDYIFIHREAAQLGPPIFEWIIAKVLRKKYIYDFDDAIWLPNYSATNAQFHRLKAYWKVKYCMKWAHQISAGNRYLANYAKQFNPNVSVIPTTIDLINYHNQLTDYDQEELVIGWTGTHTTMHYLDEIVPVLADLEKEFPFTFTVISNVEPTYALKSLRFVKWNKETEIEDLAKFSIGIMPLREDQWSEGKCGFKGLQYMALGIPALLSPVGVNKEIISHKENGYLLSSPEEWKETIKSLLTDKALREKIGKSGRKTIRERYSVEANLEGYLRFF